MSFSEWVWVSVCLTGLGVLSLVVTGAALMFVSEPVGEILLAIGVALFVVFCWMALAGCIAIVLKERRS